MSLVLLAAISMTSFTISSIIIREIKTAGLIEDSTPAIDGAYSGGEVGLYMMQRSFTGLNITDQIVSTGGARFDIAADLTDDPLTFTVSEGKESSVNLYYPENIDALDTDIRSVVITNVSGKPVKVDMYSWGDATNLICGTGNLPEGSVLTCPALAGPDFRYQILFNVNGSGASNVSVRAFNAAGAPVGLPSPFPALDSTGKLGQVNHKIRINLTD